MKEKMQMKGFIQSYNKERRVGTIVSGLDRFWFHADRIAHGPVDPEINSLVVFDVSPKPVLPGKLPVATQIVIEDSTSETTAADILAGNQNGAGVQS